MAEKVPGWKRGIRISVWAGGILFSVLLLAVLLGFVFEKKLHRMAIHQLEQMTGCRITYADSKVSFLRHWPDVTVNLSELGLNAPGKQQGADFIHVKNLHLRIGLFSLFRDQYEVNGLFLFDPVLSLDHRADGSWNFDGIFDTKSPAGDSAEVVFNLSKIRIRNGEILYEDHRDAYSAKVAGLDADLRSKWKGLLSDWTGIARADLQELKSGSFTIFRDKVLGLELEGSIDLKDGEQYVLKKLSGTFASLHYSLDGKVDRKGDDYDLDLKYKTGETSFAEFASLLPASWTETSKEVKYGGDFSLDGYIKGLFGRRHSPDFFAGFGVRNGSMRFDGLSEGLSAINLKGMFLAKAAMPALSHLSITQAQGKLGGRSVSGRMKYANFDDPFIDAEAWGEFSLEDLRKFHPALVEKTELKGSVDAKLKAKGKLRDFRNEDFSAVSVEGDFGLKQVSLDDRRLGHPLENLNGNFHITNARLEVNDFSGRSGASDFRIHGVLSSYLPWLLDSTGHLKGDFAAAFGNFQLEDFLPKTDAEKKKDAKTAFVLPRGLDLNFHATADKAVVEDFSATAVQADLGIKDQSLDLDKLSFQAFGGSANLSGAALLVSAEQAKLGLELACENIDMNSLFRTFAQMGQMSMMEDHLYGEFNGKIRMNALLNNDWSLDLPALKASGDVDIYHGRIKEFKPLQKLAAFIRMEELNDVKFEDIHGGFSILNSAFIIPKMKLRANAFSMTIEGRHGFDKTLDYLLHIALPRPLAAKSKESKVQEYVQEAEASGKKEITLPVRVKGTSDKPVFSLDKQFIKENIRKESQAEKAELKQALKTETEELFGEQDTSNVDDWIIEEKKEKGKTGETVKKIEGKLKGFFRREEENR